jgi:hypothetical protein
VGWTRFWAGIHPDGPLIMAAEFVGLFGWPKCHLKPFSSFKTSISTRLDPDSIPILKSSV